LANYRIENQEAHRQAELNRVRVLVQEGAAQLYRGEDVDANEVFRRLDEKHARLKKGLSCGFNGSCRA